MPLSDLKTASPGFLRGFNFSALVDGLVAKLFGEVERPPWLKFTISTRRDAMAMQTLFDLGVSISPERGVSMTDTGWRVGWQPPRRRFAITFPLPDNVLAEFRDEFPDLFCAAFEAALLEDAHRFYEVDPRIGWRRSKEGDTLPVSRLLDPPEHFSRDGRPISVWEDGKPRLEHPACPFCRELHHPSELPQWGGANMMWVHPECWRGT